MMTDKYAREMIIRRGVNNLGEFGYPDVRPENIMTDPIYAAFFKSMLEHNLGQGADHILKPLIAECERAAL